MVIAALLSIATVVAVIPVYLVSPPPMNVVDWYTLYLKNALLGLFDFDLMMIIVIARSGLVYCALYGALRRASQPLMALGTVIGLVSIATYFASNTAFNMLLLSNKYVAATTVAQRASRGGTIGDAGDAGDLAEYAQ